MRDNELEEREDDLVETAQVAEQEVRKEARESLRIMRQEAARIHERVFGDNLNAAKFHEVRRNMVSRKLPGIRSNYLGMSGRVSMATLLAHLATVAPDVKPEQFMVNFATIRWIEEATEEEIQEEVDGAVAYALRREKWEREQLRTLMEKYPDETTQEKRTS